MRDVADILREELVTRQARNASYSLRAFSRDLKVSTASLSECLNGRRRLSQKSLNSVAQSLGYQPFELGVAIKDSLQVVDENEILRDDEFKMISSWYYFAILNLAKLKTCKSDSKWVAKYLNLDVDVARIAIERLIRMKYIKSQDGRLIRTRRNIRTTFDIPSEGIKSFHRQTIENAAQALSRLGPEEREFITLTAAVNSKQLPVAKKLVRKFIGELSRSMQTGPVDDVFTMSIQLYPLSHTNEKK